MSRNKADLILGGLVVVLALLAILAWVPNDSATGMIVKQRGRLLIGDAMAPVVGFSVVALAGLLIIVEKRKAGLSAALSPSNLRFLLLFIGIFVLSILLMRWSGPALVTLAKAAGLTDHTYRDLRDTIPWKYTGFIIGGTTLVTLLMSYMAGRVTWRAVLIGLLATFALIAVFDLPFPDLLLPPNGDT
ncbi:hypothetical protein [Seohaeicola zhoushanensis]|uniref:Uncharacterized protein n=1 Tax=Seohaeicola zhoushanensis TaxID=1569283 RepID=A0A8J3MA25_9RHOB|nr:hypothetical protein [Seohaeicola zhoushanensis]GHF70635.1 hypothetical protein GCM10017056_47000 [Seohaeicola zhoushanensis]